MMAIWLLLVLVPAVTACDRCVHQSKLLASAIKENKGTCGYGSTPFRFYGKHVAAANPKLYRDGVGCGACFKVRCTNMPTCGKHGVEVVVTDLHESNETDFVLSRRAFKQMTGRPPRRDEIVTMEYKRTPCEYLKRNLTVEVAEESRFPDHLAIRFLFQGGQTDIVAVDVAEVGGFNWYFMTRDQRRAVWVPSRVPKGALQLRIVVTGGFDGKRIWAKHALPESWTAGRRYDTGVQITDIAQEGCANCDVDDDW